MSRASFHRLLQAAVPPVMLAVMLALVIGFAAIGVLGRVSGAV